MKTIAGGLRCWLAAAMTLAWAWACVDATGVHLLEITGTGVVLGQAFLDGNGNGVLDAADRPLQDVSVVLATTGTQTVVRTVMSNQSGGFSIKDVPIGSYQLTLDSAVLADSLVTLGATDTLSLQANDTVAFVLGATYPELTLAEVRTAVPGRTVFAKGIALNARQSFSDGTVHLQESATYLRATNVAPSSVSTGDSVRFLGTTASDNGQPTLDGVTPFILRARAQIPLPRELSTAAAATASSGTLDAALVRIRLAEISDTSTAPNGDFHFWADDGTDSVEVVFRWFLQIPTGPVRPDTVVRVNQAIGLLSPFQDGTGLIRWRLLPRGGSDVSYQTKQADVAVTTAFVPTAAMTGETVEILVTARNAGPQTATGVRVSDPLPGSLTFAGATTTVGTYDDATGIWDIGDQVAGQADTLHISVDVTGGPGTATNTAQFLGLLREVETNFGNNTASATLTIS